MRPNKFRSRPVHYHGETFDSHLEFDRYLDLKCKEIRGEVSQIRRQVRFKIIPRQTREEHVHLKTKTKVVDRTVELASYYTCDYLYREGDCIIIEDVKSSYTRTLPDYVLRRKLMVSKIARHNASRPGNARFIYRECEVKRRSFFINDR